MLRQSDSRRLELASKSQKTASIDGMTVDPSFHTIKQNALQSIIFQPWRSSHRSLETQSQRRQELPRNSNSLMSPPIRSPRCSEVPTHSSQTGNRSVRERKKIRASRKRVAEIATASMSAQRKQEIPRDPNSSIRVAEGPENKRLADSAHNTLRAHQNILAATLSLSK